MRVPRSGPLNYSNQSVPIEISFHFEISYMVLIKYCVFSKILLYIPDSVFSRCQCVYTHQAGRTPAPQQNRQSWKNSKNFKEKHNI